MPTGPEDRRRHVLVEGNGSPEPYTYPRQVRGQTTTPVRDRSHHSAELLRQLDAVRHEQEALAGRREAAGVTTAGGIALALESEPRFELALKSLDRQSDGIELLGVRQHADRMLATVFVPEGRLSSLVRLVERYATEDDARWGRPKNRGLVDSVSHIRRAALEAFWTDEPGALPEPGRSVWWEIWLRGGSDPDAILNDFMARAVGLGLQLSSGTLRFPDRTVVLARGNTDQMTASVELLDCVAELRLAKDLASFFSEISPREQGEWVDDFVSRLALPGDDCPAVCVLDTGVTRDHPLIEPALAVRDVLACDPEWGTHDHDGHGTEMAGLALHGDLTGALARIDAGELEHVLESVKILAPEAARPDAQVTDPAARKELYGKLTQEGSGRIEIEEPTRRRVFCIAVATDEGRDRGVPSSWSAEVDRLAFGADDGERRLFVLAAGNVDRPKWSAYPDRNDVDQVHDPGQAWNALTVGAFTEKSVFDPAKYPGYTPIARPGLLSPCSTTSQTWASMWPNKPDLVFEGGNGACDAGGQPDALDELGMLSTFFQPSMKLLVATGDTSAAAAQVARLAAILTARYPNFWPETIRGLLVHSTNWTRAMLDEAESRASRRQEEYLLRRYGYGVPDLDRACWSASNALALVVQDALTPYQKEGGQVSTKDMNLHTLPWPRRELEQLLDTQVELRVTLSYFVEPNPARRGWKYRHRYQSHGLRFALRGAGESRPEFRARVSKDAQDDDYEATGAGEVGWRLGRRRNRGSIHSDMWTGSAADLANRYDLAIFPVGGWWKERPHLERWGSSIRYTLIVSIRTPSTEVDIYTPVANMVSVPVPVSGS